MFDDTDPQVLKVWLERQRQMTPEEKLQAVFAMTDLVLRAQEAGIRARYPEAGEREVFLRAASLRLSRELMIRAYGWDPELHK